MDEADALRHRLVSRAQVRAAADWLERRPQGRRVHGRPDRDITELLRACLTHWQVSDAIARMRQLSLGVVLTAGEACDVTAYDELLQRRDIDPGATSCPPSESQSFRSPVLESDLEFP